jgi:fumarate reductase subunit C
MSRNPYVRPMSKTTWYLRNGRYRIYALREITCLLVGYYSFLVLFGLVALSRGPEAWNGFLASQQGTGMVIWHAIALIYFLIYQTFGWFHLAPKAMPLQVGEKKVAASTIVIGHYVVWAVFSLFVFWLAGVI